MFVYNVTIKVEHSIAAKWLEWLRKEHIPDIIGTGCFTDATILRIHNEEDKEGVTYAVQYHTGSVALYEKYISQFADEMRKRATHKWGDRFIAFRTFMEVVN